jgi:ornithine cyclodeaminase/alanine dehydrogenase-like protein (mu-crystallin family)
MSKVVPFPVEAAQTAAEVIQGADIVVTATGKLDKPVFKEKWVTEGALVLPVHTAGWEPRTLHQVDKFIVDDWQQFSQTLGQPGGFYMPLPDLYAELGEIVTHKKPGRESKSERIINFNFGIAIHDVAVASVVFARAKEKGIGTKLNLTDGELPLSP